MAREILKTGKNFKRYTDGTILLQLVQASYPHTGEPDIDETTKKKSWSLVSMLKKSTHKEAASEVKKMIDELLIERKAKGKVASDKLALKDGDTSGKDTYAGHWLVNARENKRPSVRDKDKTPLDKEEADEKIVGGVFVDVLVRPWFQDNSFGKRVNMNLVAVQFRKDTGVRFGEGRISEDEIDDTFESYDDEDGGFGEDAGSDDDDFGGL